jgi:NitT/TauT family transport system substrate-binding protein
MKTKLTPLAKLMIVTVILAGLAFVFWKFKDQIMPKGQNGNQTNNQSNNNNSDGNRVIRIGVVTWGGYAGGEYYNEGFAANENSRFFKDYGFKVDFKVIDDFAASRSAWKSGDIDLLWTTVDAFTTEVKGLEQFNPQIVFQADWSRGGDAVVAVRGINNVKDLKGKKVAFAEMTPSHTFLLWLLDAGNMTTNDIQPVKVASAVDAADLFRKGQVDAAVVWSPDDADCVAKIAGSKILQNTKDASNIIADVFVAKKDFVDSHGEDLKNLLRGWFKGAAEINTDDQAKHKAAKILSQGMSQPEDFCYTAINNTRICNYGDNFNFFGMNSSYKGVTGEDIYNKMETKYRKAGYIKEQIQSWRTIGNAPILSSISDMAPLKGQEAEGQATFTAAADNLKNKEAISTKQVSINFPSGSSTLDDNMKTIIDLQFLDIAKSFAKARIRIEGNTDNAGSRQANIDLSKKRAQAVADYLINTHGFDKNRFIIVGNGPDKPVSDNKSDDGRSKNRRTDFELVQD